jgi:hypothetical protein
VIDVTWPPRAGALLILDVQPGEHGSWTGIAAISSSRTLSLRSTRVEHAPARCRARDRLHRCRRRQPVSAYLAKSWRRQPAAEAADCPPVHDRLIRTSRPWRAGQAGAGDQRRWFRRPRQQDLKYRLFAHAGSPWFNGFKLFYHEDLNLMRPRMVLALRPRPNVVIYE